MKREILLFRNLPVGLRIIWAALLISLVLIISGYFTRHPWLNLAGWTSFAIGYSLALLNVFRGKRTNARSDNFSLGVIVAPIISLYIVGIIGVIGLLTFLILTFINGFSLDNTLRLLHFHAVVLVFLLVTGIGTIAQRDNPGLEDKGAPNLPPGLGEP